MSKYSKLIRRLNSTEFVFPKNVSVAICGINNIQIFGNAFEIQITLVCRKRFINSMCPDSESVEQISGIRKLV